MTKLRKISETTNKLLEPGSWIDNPFLANYLTSFYSASLTSVLIPFRDLCINSFPVNEKATFLCKDHNNKHHITLNVILLPVKGRPPIQ